MDNRKTPTYYLTKIINDIFFVIENTKYISLNEFTSNDILNCAISFKFIQISENAKQLPISLTMLYPAIPWHKINGLRNRIVHDYGNVQLEIIYNTALIDFPILLEQLKEIK